MFLVKGCILKLNPIMMKTTPTATFNAVTAHTTKKQTLV